MMNAKCRMQNAELNIQPRGSLFVSNSAFCILHFAFRWRVNDC
jgi:hypothetical protein